MIQGCNAAFDEEFTLITACLLADGHTIPCFAGCSACCRQAIVATPFEAALIGVYIKNDPVKLDMFTKNYDKWNMETKGLRDEYVAWVERCFLRGQNDGSFHYSDFNTPCPFLVDNLCRIYPVRPYCCRAYLALFECCSNPIVKGRKPGFQALDVCSETDFYKRRKEFIKMAWEHFDIDPAKTRTRLLPDLVHLFLNNSMEEFLNACVSPDRNVPNGNDVAKG